MPTNLHQELCFDTLDLVDIILVVERRFHVSIPDEVPLRTVGNFVAYLAEQLSGGSANPLPHID